MNFAENKIEIAIVAFTVFAIGALFSLFGSHKQRAMIGDEKINYEMPRPKNEVVNEFDLQGREIERNLVNPYEKKQKEQALDAKLNSPQSIKNAKNQVSPKAKSSPKKKSQVDINVVEGDESSPLRDESLIEKTNYSPSVSISFNPTRDNGAELQEKNLMSPDQWRALLSAQPTKENIAKLVEAFGKKELDSVTFYQIVRELLNSQKSEEQSLGLIALQSFPSLKSFILVVQSMDRLDAKNKAAAHNYLLTYNQPKNLGILAMALNTNEIEVVTIAAEIIMDGLDKVKNAQQSSATGTVSNVNPSTIRDYNRFIPIFQSWQNNTDSQLQGIASSALAQLQAG